MNKFRVYPSGLIHYGKPRDGVVSAWMGYYRSLCGRELIGHEQTSEPEEWEPICQRCAASFDRMRKQYQEMEAKLK